MILTSFLIGGVICCIADIIYIKFKLTPGHITVMFTILGAILSIFNIYDLLIERYGVSLNFLIVNFGNTLVKSAYQGYQEVGLIGIFSNMLSNSGLIISFVVIASMLGTIIFKPHD